MTGQLKGGFAVKKCLSLLLLLIGAAVSAQSQTGTNTYISQQFVAFPLDVDYYLVATLPASFYGSLDHLHLVATLNGDWYSNYNSTIDMTVGNRGGFNYYYTVVGKSVLAGHTHIVAYQQTDGSVNLYLSLADSFDVASYVILNNMQETVYQPAVETQNATPPGTLIFDTASASYPPVTYIDPSGNITANGGVTTTSVTFPDGTTMSTAPQISTSINGNVGVGSTLYNITTGSYDTSIGLNAGNYIGVSSTPNQTSSNSVYLGVNASPQADGDQYEVVIGANATGNGSASVTLGSSTTTFKTVLNGNVGIGTTTPGAKLEVNGNVKLTSGSGASITFADGTVQTTAYVGTSCPLAELVMPDKTIVAQGGDYAESVDVNGDRASYEPGDVMVIDPTNPEHFLKSSTPYSTLVAGIYSTKPGYVGRRQPGDPKMAKSEIPMAMIGIVPTKVTTENGPVNVGDLLVTSSTSGYAMKGTKRKAMSGAIVGKALAKLDSGSGTIEVLVSLQ